MSNQQLKWTDVSNAGTPASVAAIMACTALVPSTRSPIDEFLLDLRGRVQSGSPAALAHDDRLAEQLLLAFTSAVENYIRSMLTGLIECCPLSRAHANSQTVSVLAARTYSARQLGLAVLDGSSLADAKEIKKKTNNLLGITIHPGSDLDSALTEFDIVCHLRHAAVHSRGLLGSRSQAELGVSGSGPLQLRLDFPLVQNVAAVCEYAVRAYNRFIFQSTVERWIKTRHIAGTWAVDKPHFEAVWRMCYSVADHKVTPRPFDAYRRFLLAVGLP